MKNFFCTMLFSLILLSAATAQFDSSKLFAGANLGYAKPVGDFSTYSKAGFSYNIMVGYKLKEKISVGIEYGSALTAAIDGNVGISLYGLSTYLAKGWYRFTEGNFAPYVGLGVGLGQIAEPDITSGGITYFGSKRIGLGGNIELGINISGFNISYGYNITSNTPKTPAYFPDSADLSVNYHRFALGYIYNF